MATTVTSAAVLARIRDFIREPTADFWSDAELYRGYNQGSVLQHQIVLSNATATRRDRAHDHEYLRAYASVTTGTTTAGDSTIAMPADYYQRLWVKFGAPLVEAEYVPPHFDFETRNFPHFRGTRRQWVFTEDISATATGILRFSSNASGGTSIGATDYEVAYYRGITPLDETTPAANTDVADPYNEGPIMYAAAASRQKKDEDVRDLFARAEAAMHSIVPPPQSRQGR